MERSSSNPNASGLRPQLRPQLRPVRPEDTTSIITLIGGIFADYGLRLDVEREEVHLLDPGPFFRASGGEFWVVEAAGVVCATAAVRLLPDAGELKCLYVHPSLRRQGWGRRLTELAIEQARAAGRMRFFLWSDTRFVEAHALYRRLGFQPMGERELHDSNQSRELGFERAIGSADRRGMETTGIEPATSALRTRRSPN